MAPDDNTQLSSSESANEAYKNRAFQLDQNVDKEADEAAEAANPNLESVETPLSEEAKFVANPDDLRKEVDSEEKFSAELPDGEADSLDVEKKAPAKKTAAKKTAAKKG